MGLWHWIAGSAFAIAAASVARAAWAGPRPVPSPAPAPSSDVYTTPLDQVDTGAIVWAVNPNGGQITAEPLKDRRGGYARLSYTNALALAGRLGVRLPSQADVDAVHAAAQAAGLALKPCTLPGDASMRSKARCAEHDACVRDQLEARRWDGRSAVSNVGKDWLAGAPAGKAINYGWIVNGHALQPVSSAHGDFWTDYSQCTRFVR